MAGQDREAQHGPKDAREKMRHRKFFWRVKMWCPLCNHETWFKATPRGLECSECHYARNDG